MSKPLDQPLYQKYDQMERFREGLPGEKGNMGALASIDKILAHRKMQVVDKRRNELRKEGLSFADVAQDGISIEQYAKSIEAREMGRSPFDTHDLGINESDPDADFEYVEVTDNITGKKKMERRAKSATGMRHDDYKDMEDEEGFEEDVEEAARLLEHDDPTFRRPPGTEGKSALDEDEDPALIALAEIRKARSEFAKRINDWEDLDQRRQKHLGDAKKYTEQFVHQFGKQQ